ncbi:MAG: GDSL-type esterase/lipase family protein [Ilumatobacteraceae bacterium]
MTAVVAGLCLASVGAILTFDIQPSAGRADGRTLLVLGDSLTYGTAYPGFGNVTPQLVALGTFDSLVIDGEFARNISGPARTSRNGVKTYKKMISEGLRPSAVIVALGSNDLQQSAKPAFHEAQIRELLAAIGDIPVVWINVLRTDTSYYPRRSAMFNRVLLRIAPEYPNLIVVDWASMLAAHPKWFAYDKLHLQPRGYKVRATVYVQAARSLWDALNPPVAIPETTIPATTIPETTTTVSG